MKCTYFFRRFDILREWTRALLIPFGVILYIILTKFHPTNMKNYIILLSACGVILLVLLFGATLKIGHKKEDVAQYLSVSFTNFRRSFSTVQQSRMVFLSGFTHVREKLARSVGNHLAFPQCRLIAFEKQEDGILARCRLLDMYEGTETDSEILLSKHSAMTVCDWDEAGKYLDVRIYSDGVEKLALILSDNHDWAEFLSHNLFRREDR